MRGWGRIGRPRKNQWSEKAVKSCADENMNNDKGNEICGAQVKIIRVSGRKYLPEGIRILSVIASCCV